jgi:hypothetical protein
VVRTRPWSRYSAVMAYLAPTRCRMTAGSSAGAAGCSCREPQAEAAKDGGVRSASAVVQQAECAPDLLKTTVLAMSPAAVAVTGRDARQGATARLARRCSARNEKARRSASRALASQGTASAPGWRGNRKPCRISTADSGCRSPTPRRTSRSSPALGARCRRLARRQPTRRSLWTLLLSAACSGFGCRPARPALR